MILTREEIKRRVRKKQIKIAPFEEALLNPNSYNYRLGDELLEFNNVLDAKTESKPTKIVLTQDGYILKPNKLYLAYTFEEIGSPKFVTQLIGRSSIGRLGLFLQVTAPLGHVGTCHHWTLELKVVQPLKVYPKMKIGQVTFWKVKGAKQINYACGEYKNYQTAHISKFYKELSKS